MILEAFAKYLQESDPELPATFILARWLENRLSHSPQTNVDKVLHCELSLGKIGESEQKGLALQTSRTGPSYMFNPLSETGRNLLESLYQYSLSYEQQKWARWVHIVKASDFNKLHKG